jgi:hypothetical protein
MAEMRDNDDDDDDKDTNRSSISSLSSSSSFGDDELATLSGIDLSDTDDDPQKTLLFHKFDELRGYYASDDFGSLRHHHVRVQLTEIESLFCKDWANKIEGDDAVTGVNNVKYFHDIGDLMKQKKQLVIHGCAGIGKTALVKWIAHQWATNAGNEFLQRLDAVFVVQLSKLGRRANYFESIGLEGMEWQIWERRESVLFIVDDYDIFDYDDNDDEVAVASAFLGNPRRSLVSDIIVRYPHWIIATRSDALQTLDATFPNVYRICALDEHMQSRFVSNKFMMFEERQHQPDTSRLMFLLEPNVIVEVALQAALKDKEYLGQIGKIPLIASILCKAFLKKITEKAHVRSFIAARFFKRYFSKYYGFYRKVDDMDQAASLLQSDRVQKMMADFRMLGESLSTAGEYYYHVKSPRRRLSRELAKTLKLINVADNNICATADRWRQRIFDSDVHRTFQQLIATGLICASISGRSANGKLCCYYQFIHPLIGEFFRSWS